MKIETIISNTLDMIWSKTLPRIRPAAGLVQSVPKMAQDILNGIADEDVCHVLSPLNFDALYKQLPQIRRAGPETLLDGTFLKQGGAKVLDELRPFEGQGKHVFWLKAAKNKVKLIEVFAEPIWTLAMFDICCKDDLPTSIVAHSASQCDLSAVVGRWRGMEPQIPLVHQRRAKPEDHDTIQAFNERHIFDCARAALRLMQAVTGQAALPAPAKSERGRAHDATGEAMPEGVWLGPQHRVNHPHGLTTVKVTDLDCNGRPIGQMDPLPMEDTARRLKGEARASAAPWNPQVGNRRHPVRHWVKGHYRRLPNGKVVYVCGHWRGGRVVLEIFRLATQPVSHQQPPVAPRKRPSARCDARNLRQADRAHKHRHRSLPAPAAAPLLPQAELR